MEKNNESCPLKTNFEQTDKLSELFLEQRNKKEKIYNAFEEYIQVLKEILKYETNIHKKYLIEEEIKKLRRIQENYYVELPLANCLSKNKIDNLLNDEERKHALEEASKVYGKNKRKNK